MSGCGEKERHSACPVRDRQGGEGINLIVALILEYAFIFGARVVDVSLATIRLLMIIRGKRLYASAIGFLEIIVYITALSRVVNQVQAEPLKLLVYALGFATGSYVGSTFEEKLALGVQTIQVVLTPSSGKMLAANLRERGYGVTVMDGQGLEGPKLILLILVNRKDIKSVLKYVESICPEAFVTVMDAQRAVGGILHPRKGK